MSSMPYRYRVLAAVMLVVMVACLLVWLLGVRPYRVRAQEEREALVEKHKSLRQRGWTQDRESLERLLGERTRLLDGAGSGQPGLKLRAEQVRQYANAMFRERIQPAFPSSEAFVRHASNIDFREAFNALQRRFASEGIWAAPEILNLSEESSNQYTYQLLLQVWTLDRLADVILAHRLRVLTDPTVTVRAGGRDQPAARISLEPLMAYYLEPESPLPYLLGIPVRVRLQGDLARVREFLLALTAEGNFLPAVEVEVYADDPRALRRRPDDADRDSQVILDVTCSAFFVVPGGEAPPPSRPAPATTKSQPPEGV